MANAFLLRFQEACVESRTITVLGTATKTSTKEQADSDPATNALSALKLGTETITRVATEQRDADATVGSQTIPRTAVRMGTHTATAVRETSDTDPGQLANQVMPR